MVNKPSGWGAWITARVAAPISPGAARSVVALFVLMLTLSAANLFFTANATHQLRVAVLASCRFAADRGAAPVTAAVGMWPSRLAVEEVADSRQQWRALGCPGRLAPPQPSFTHWARVYGLPAN